MMRDFSRIVGVALILVAASCTTAGNRGSGLSGTLEPEITESSGLIQSSIDRDLFWTLNDSGNEPVIYAVDLEGRIHGRAEIEGVSNIDWEALTSDGRGHLYIGEIGNNANNRKDLALYVIREPDPYRDQMVPVIRTIPFSFPDQVRFPDPERMNFDAEAIFWSGNALWVLSKHRSDTRTKLYRLDLTTEKVDKIDEIEIGSMVTDAAISSDGILAVLTYSGIHFFDISESIALQGKKIGTLWFQPEVSKQSEAISWQDDSIVFTNEQRDVHFIERPLQRSVNSYPESWLSSSH